MLSQVKSAALIGIDAFETIIEVDAHQGLPGETIVGLPDTIVKESKSRIRSAIKNAGLKYPLKAYTINLAPAELKKEGPLLDLPIAVAILQATEQLPQDSNSLIIGELSLDGSIKPIRGILSICELAKKNKVKRIILPAKNYKEATLVSEIQYIPVTHLNEVINFYKNSQIPKLPDSKIDTEPEFAYLDIAEVKGQHTAKRALKIAATGKHNILLIGPPGSGKTMLLKRLAGILPVMNQNETIETYKIKSIAGQTLSTEKINYTRPFRSPHHTISYAGMVGGGKNPQPGEISLAHNGILFLDELPEFSRNVLEVLRQPLEDKKITISRSNFKIEYPANFIFAAAMNPCPCGNYGSSDSNCTCLAQQRQKYLKKISGPILDRIDIVIEVPRVKKENLFKATKKGTSSQNLREEVSEIRKIAISRQNKANAELSPGEIEQFCIIDQSCQTFIGRYIDQGLLTARSYHKVLKLARTIADMENSKDINLPHISEALQYRKNSYL